VVGLGYVKLQSIIIGEQQMNEATQPSALQEKSVADTAKAYAAGSPTTGLAPSTIRRRVPESRDVQIDILYCGV